MPYPVMQVAHAFVAFCDEHGDLITNLKLQKLLYYAQGWHLGLYGAPLFREPLQAWIRGPVVPVVYDEFKRFGSKPIQLEGLPPWEAFPPRLAEHVKDIWESHGSLSAYDLERLSHREPAWLKARGDLPADAPSTAELDLRVMEEFFRGKVAPDE